MRLALFEPDIPQNAGAMMRLAAALGVPLDLIEPCGFVLDDRRLRRAGMDYLHGLDFVRHRSWDDFRADARADRSRLVLLTTAAADAYTDVAYGPGDVLIVGRESAGAPAAVHAAVDLRVRVPMAVGRRSLNVATAAAMVLGEALRQTGGFPGTDGDTGESG